MGQYTFQFEEAANHGAQGLELIHMDIYWYHYSLSAKKIYRVFYINKKNDKFHLN